MSRVSASMFALVAAGLLAAVGAQDGGGVTAPQQIIIRDEGTDQGRVRTIDCAGASVDCTVSGSVATVTIIVAPPTMSFANQPLAPVAGELIIFNDIQAGEVAWRQVLSGFAGGGAEVVLVRWNPALGWIVVG